MPIICSVSLYLSCSAIRSGISSRQGGHQVAQKLIRTTLPRSEAVDTGRPSRSVAVNAATSTRSFSSLTVPVGPLACFSSVSTPRV